MYGNENGSWMNLIKVYLKDHTFIEDNKQVEKILKKMVYLSITWRIIDCIKGVFSLPLLIFLNDEKTNYVLRELHEEICGSHITSAPLAFKALRNGYFYLNIKVDALELV